MAVIGHNLNLAVEKGLSAAFVQEHRSCILQEVEKAARPWSYPGTEGLPSHKLKIDVVTQWTSSYEMVERLMEQMEAIRIVLASDRKSSHLIPSWQDYDVLDSITGALKPLKEMTDRLAGEKGVTVSAVKPIVQYITTDVLVEKHGDSALTKEMKKRMKVDLELCYSDPNIDQLLSIAAFLDPRFKLMIGRVS